MRCCVSDAHSQHRGIRSSFPPWSVGRWAPPRDGRPPERRPDDRFTRGRLAVPHRPGRRRLRPPTRGGGGVNPQVRGPWGPHRREGERRTGGLPLLPSGHGSPLAALVLVRAGRCERFAAQYGGHFTRPRNMASGVRRSRRHEVFAREPGEAALSRDHTPLATNASADAVPPREELGAECVGRVVDIFVGGIAP